MTSANVDLVRSIYAAWERGDYGSAEWAHPQITFVIADGPQPGTWNGLAEMRQASRGVFDVWEDYRAEPEEIHEIDDARVLVIHRRSGRGKTSRIELGKLQSKGASVWHIRDDKVTRLVNYLDHSRALADLGLSARWESRPL
jgi:ketosteroid isomerase-like protein